MDLIGYCNGSTEKSNLCKTSKRQELTLPVHKNGFIYTGDCTEYNENVLTIVDFDVKDNVDLKINELPSLCKNTFVVKSGGGGYHAYFWMDSIVKQTQGYVPKNTKLKAIDIRCRGGKIIAPGTKLDCHENPYSIVIDKKIKHISINRYELLLDEMLSEIPEFKIKNKKHSYTPSTVKSNGKIVLKNTPKMKRWLKKCWDGEYIIKHGKKDGKQEHLLWDMVYRDALQSGFTIEQFLDQMEKTQPGFDRKHTVEQLKHRWTHVFVSNRGYYEMFKKEIDESIAYEDIFLRNRLNNQKLRKVCV